MKRPTASFRSLANLGRRASQRSWASQGLSVFAATFLAVAIPGSAASASDVASGCAAPAVKSGYKTFYVDPVHGSMSGDGSSAHPWHTLQEVLDVKSKLVANAPPVWFAGLGWVRPGADAPIRSGDIIYLMNGNHGSAFLQGYFGTTETLYGYDNTDFITIAAAPGQTPVVKQLTLKGVNKWAFRGLTFQSLQDVPSNHGQPFTNKIANTNDYYLVGMNGPNSNVIFVNNTFQSQADTSGWTVNDWLYKRVSGITSGGGSCLSLTNNKFQNIGFAMATQRANHVLIKGNTVNMFSDDGIDYGSSNLLIEDNTITNCIEDGDGFHQDGMQGQPYGEIPVEDVVINRNTVINQTQDLISPANLQGIDEFDGVWRNVTVTNNVVAVNAFHGITYFNVKNILVANNTVIGTNPKVATWIMVGAPKNKGDSSAVTVVNNIATSYSVWLDQNFSHNMMASLSNQDIRRFKPDNHILANAEPISLFTKYNNSFHSYDFHLSSSRAAGIGDGQVVVPFDRDDRPRKLPIDLGAYVYHR